MKDGVLEFVINITTFEFEDERLSIPPPSLSRELASLLDSGAATDVTLTLASGAALRAHSAVLCARSPVLRASLCGSPLAASDGRLSIHPSIDEPTLRRVLCFLYTDECEPAGAEEAQHLLHAADHLAVERLRAICERFLATSLSVDNAAWTLTLAHQLSAPALKKAALRFVAQNAGQVVETEGWRHMVATEQGLVLEALVAGGR